MSSATAALKRIWAGHKAVVIAVPAIVVIAAIVGGLLLVNASNGTPQATASPIAEASVVLPTESPTPEITPSPTPYMSPTPTPMPSGWAYSDLDGVAAPSGMAHRIPIAVMIDDQVAARPQSGVSSASIVYQAPADGDQDRYMLVFQEGVATSVGPVRSTRTYYVTWASEYHAVLGHFGGDSISLKVLLPAAQKAKTIYNMDSLKYHQDCPYHRIKTRPAPHNAYTTSQLMWECAGYLKYPQTIQTTVNRPFRDNTPTAQLPASQVISIVYRTGKVGYEFNRPSDSYLRLVSGKYEIDPATGGHVHASDIIVMYQTKSISPYSEAGHSRPDIATVGSGKALIFQEGKEIVGTWKKKNSSALTRFYDQAGNEIPLVRGEIFIQSIPTSYAVTVK
jgi:hypothetical protein